MTQKTIKHIWRNNNIELIYAFFSKLNDENGSRSFSNFGINFSSNINISYDNDTGKIKIIKSPIGIKNTFWSVDTHKENVNNITLILGENGIGKSTLLRAIDAAMNLPIDHRLDEYMLLFYDNDSGDYYIKTTCNKILENKSFVNAENDDFSGNVFLME